MNFMAQREMTFVDRMSSRFGLDVDRNCSYREQHLSILKKIYNGTIYDNLAPWFSEYSGNEDSDSYVPLMKRRPGVIYGIPKIIVNESVAMLFGEGHFPFIRGKCQEETRELQKITNECNIKSKMLLAAKKGAIGSVCILIKVLNGKFYLDVLDTIHLTPIFDFQEPSKLIKLTEKIKTRAEVLISKGYSISEEDKNKFFYLEREWNETEEIYYLPYSEEEEKQNKDSFKPKIDKKRSCIHDFGFAPAVWIKNTEDDQKIDGECIFENIVDICIEIDYQLSQLGRLLRYNSDPTLVVKDPSQMQNKEIIKGQTMDLGENGDAFYLEMDGKISEAVINYIRCLREFALEVVRGNRANPDKISAIHSGKALQMLNSNLIGLVGEMRLFYGENGLKRILGMIFDIARSGKYKLKTDDISGNNKLANIFIEDVSLEWPDWYPPTPQDDLQEAQALQNYVGAEIISKESALNIIADKYNINDVENELTKIETDSNNSTSVPSGSGKVTRGPQNLEGE